MAKMRDDQDVKNEICDLIRAWGLDVEQLRERDGQKTPDLLAIYQDERYVIEVKSRLDDEELSRAEEELLARGKMVEHVELVGHLSSIARIMEKGVGQIRSLPPRSSDFRLLWLDAKGARPKVQMQQFHRTLYGTENIVDMEDLSTTYCYFFHQSELYKFRDDIDGVVLANGDERQLCLNSFSPRTRSLRESFLVSAAFEHDIFDPEALEREGRILIADCEEDRRAPNADNAVIHFLQKKYGRTKIMNIDMGYYELRWRRSI